MFRLDAPGRGGATGRANPGFEREIDRLRRLLPRHLALRAANPRYSQRPCVDPQCRARCSSTRDGTRNLSVAAVGGDMASSIVNASAAGAARADLGAAC
jgi:hypothetical protein